ncbi:MAG: calpastatin [Gemmatales bacterium]|nr:MAG: calpastatin [Gemmatales bacterium]
MATDPYGLNRFIEAQQGVYEQALAEIRQGRKRSHWMWFVFPQIDGLGFSATTKRYSIKSREEARAYLDHPVLGARLRECCEALLALEGRTAHEIFGYPDDLKLQSCATLFAQVAGKGSVFEQILEKYYGGQPDEKTLRLLAKESGEK